MSEGGGERESVRIIRAQILARYARGGNLGVPATVAGVFFSAVRCMQSLAGPSAPHNFRAVSAKADTARNQNNRLFVAHKATIHGGQIYGYERRDI
jgi:hypothetical protein